MRKFENSTCNLKYLRRQKGVDMTQKELAEKLGVTIATVVNIEKGKHCRMETVRKLMQIFNCTLGELYEIK